MSYTMTLRFDGRQSSDHEIDLYDAAEAMREFQRSLVMINHFFLHQKAIHNVSSRKSVQILSCPPSRGSWEVEAVISLFLNFETPLASFDSSIRLKFVSDIIMYVWKKTLGLQAELKENTIRYLGSS